MKKKFVNIKYSPDGEGSCTLREATKKEISDGRKKAVKAKANFEFRSCYECNGAHAHLMEEGRVINCFGCGKWFVDGVDIMDYSSK